MKIKDCAGEKVRANAKSNGITEASKIIENKGEKLNSI